jgi:Family of unknown function (DUF5670)
MTIAALLAVLWALGLMSAYSMSWFIHVLLAMAFILALIRIVQGQRIE